MEILQKEVDCVGKLRHQNVVALLGVCASQLALGDAALSLTLVFEYCEGGSLFERIHARARPLHALKWCSQICAGMAYLHERNFVHRDLVGGEKWASASWAALLTLLCAEVGQRAAERE